MLGIQDAKLRLISCKEPEVSSECRTANLGSVALYNPCEVSLSLTMLNTQCIHSDSIMETVEHDVMGYEDTLMKKVIGWR